jgi:hypothetical protein
MPVNVEQEFVAWIDLCSKALDIEGARVSIQYADNDFAGAGRRPENVAALTKLFAGGKNIYAIWRKLSEDSKWQLVYIGQRKTSACRQRVRQHLFSTPLGTESKLKRVQEAVLSGQAIALSAILVRPDFMRRAIEEALIMRYRTLGCAQWNTHG